MSKEGNVMFEAKDEDTVNRFDVIKEWKLLQQQGVKTILHLQRKFDGHRVLLQ